MYRKRMHDKVCHKQNSFRYLSYKYLLSTGIKEDNEKRNKMNQQLGKTF